MARVGMTPATGIGIEISNLLKDRNVVHSNSKSHKDRIWQSSNATVMILSCSIVFILWLLYYSWAKIVNAQYHFLMC